ncbi:histidine kinase [Leptobacterium flavescens]|uniref:Histidine kinase n=1 Tax=Leptobacterium flavescens TaxID=472055 RepID=A0A6P0UK67_9FLAO|nr:sensor histidine kinase [Leptobacterium flavescens]NER13695.1 histidine kinase [Leptobacterium flavescens]
MATADQTPFPLISGNRIVNHLIFWIVSFGGITLIQSFAAGNSDDLTCIFFQNLKHIIPLLITAYFINYYLIPVYFRSGRYLLFIVFGVIFTYFVCALDRIINVHIAEPLFREGEFVKESIYEIMTDWKLLISDYFPRLYLIAFAMTFVRLIKSKFEIEQRNAELEREKAAAELNFLKSQIHPHFLFNTLNNLYVLTLKKSDQAPDTVIKLSEMLDYMLYKCSDRYVSIENEVQLLDNYIALEKLRYGDSLQIEFLKEIDNNATEIAPLILLSIVENAFKHGASGTSEDAEIKIELKLRDRQLNFKVYNDKNPLEQADPANYKKGIGIRNIRKQLELIYKEYNFAIEETDKSYTVNLFIDLRNEDH